MFDLGILILLITSIIKIIIDNQRIIQRATGFSYFNLKEPKVSTKEMLKNQRLWMQLLDFFNFENHDDIPERILRIF